MNDLNSVIRNLNMQIKKMYSNFKGVYLYGSRVGNSAAPDSDIDIVALFDNSLNRAERMKLWGIIGKLEAEYDIIFDFHPMSENELKNNPVYYNQVVNKGLYYDAR